MNERLNEMHVSGGHPDPLEPDPVERALSLLVNAARVSPPLRDAVATVEAEIRDLRDVLVFADGGWVHQTGKGLADIYQPEAEAQSVIARAGCWPRGSHDGR
jgi:hypothetical protein